MIVKESNIFGNLSEEELNDFETANQVKLPAEYRSFLLENNGGVPINQLNQSPQTIVTYIFGMHNGDYYASLYKHIDMFNTRLPLSCFPIASDPFGNLFIMSLHTENYGQIFFWDHEGEPEEQNGHYIDNVSFVSYSFDKFLKDLKLVAAKKRSSYFL